MASTERAGRPEGLPCYSRISHRITEVIRLLIPTYLTLYLPYSFPPLLYDCGLVPPRGDPRYGPCVPPRSP